MSVVVEGMMYVLAGLVGKAAASGFRGDAGDQLGGGG